MWNVGVTPQSIVRLMGPWGPDLVGKYVFGRFHGGLDQSCEGGSGFNKWPVQKLFVGLLLLPVTSGLALC